MTCTACGLCAGRRHQVPGEGPAEAAVWIIGEAPGEEEDRLGRPFVGPSGQLLDRILRAGGVPREELRLTNLVQCRPPQQRPPEHEEVTTCTRMHLEPELQASYPRMLVTLGEMATRHFLGDVALRTVRGAWTTWRSVPLLPMFHPAFLLRNDNREPSGPKALTWNDIRAVRRAMDTPPAWERHPWVDGWAERLDEPSPSPSAPSTPAVTDDHGQGRLFGSR